MFRRAVLLLIIWLALAAGCARLPDTGLTPLKITTWSDLNGYLLTHKADLVEFRVRGPFAVATHTDFTFDLSPTERINADLFLSASAGKAPLVIFLHGYASTKEDHTYQALHVASWGMHSLALQLPNASSWEGNGKKLARIVNFIARAPASIDTRIDVDRIILVGHSFGGTSVAIALAEGARAAGGILLDPAVVGREIPRFLRQIDVPVMLLGADRQVSVARNRDFFYRFIRSGVFEVSIKDAAHEDAQYPSRFAQTTEALQITFVSALTAAALSLSATGKLDYAWASFGDALETGKLVNAQKK